MSGLRWALPLAGCMMLGTMLTPTLAQDVDPALADAWAFMQANMPGVPYDLLAAACAEGTVTIYHGTTTETMNAQEAGFEKLFPCINVERLQLESGELRERFLS